MAAIIKRPDTARSLLNRLKTVDGAGSGLDADLLDGLSSAAFIATSLLTARGQIIRRGASAPEALAAQTADTFLGGDGTDVTTRTAAQVRTSLGFEYGTWTPAFTSGTGSLTSTGSYSGNYWKINRAVWIFGQGTITNNGTGATSIVVSGLPFASDTTSQITGRNDITSGAQLQGGIASGASTLTLFTYNNTYPGGTGAVLSFAGCYRAAS